MISNGPGSLSKKEIKYKKKESPDFELFLKVFHRYKRKVLECKFCFIVVEACGNVDKKVILIYPSLIPGMLKTLLITNLFLSIT
jgi:hypothetical protein